MMNKVNLRELILEILLEISKGERHSHLIIRGTLEKYQYLEKQERASFPESVKALWNTVCVWTIF